MKPIIQRICFIKPYTSLFIFLQQKGAFQIN